MREPATREKRGRPGVQLCAEAVTPEGVLNGFAYDPEAIQPPIIQVVIGGALAAEARAHLFRPDLLVAGLSHGHHGFAARLRQPVKPGAVNLTLVCAQLRKPGTLTIPRQLPHPPASVEFLITPPRSWTGTEFLARPSCLPWTQYATRLGTERFIDAAFQFVLRRWPSKPEAAVHARALAHGNVSPEGFVVQLLQSRERGDMTEELMSPFDAEFGFA